jgi:hypothetical protein
MQPETVRALIIDPLPLGEEFMTFKILLSNLVDVAQNLLKLLVSGQG